MNIKVAVRVRPFNEREKLLGSECCVKMNQKQTILIGENNQKNKTFTFDHCFWSHDGFSTKKNGYLSPKNSQYADQDLVYKELGKDLLKNSLKGYNCCLFAYGQTGSGKSYSIFGYNKNKGLVPMIC